MHSSVIGVSEEEKGAVRYRDLLFTNTLDIMANGDLYFTDSSWKFTRAEHAVDVGGIMAIV
jgi:hypothetical protein